MRIDVDWDRCEGHGICADQAPEVFALDDEGELHYAFDNGDIPDDLASSVRSAIGACPTAGLSSSETRSRGAPRPGSSAPEDIEARSP